MHFVIFPKQFEKDTFMNSLKGQGCSVEEEPLCPDAPHSGNLYWVRIEIHDKNAFFCFIIYVCGESDILFAMKLNLLISRLAQKERFKFLLFGSCGATFKTDLGSCYVIDKATKFDRGIITDIQKNETYKITMKEDKCLHKDFKNCEQWTSFLQKISIFSSNHLFEAKKPQMVQKLCDMETYEFALVMDYNGISSYNCIRYVSDFPNLADYEGTVKV